jgi:copper chaperone CopZ
MPAITLHIEGMTCGHCLNAVSRALHSVTGVEVKSVQIGRAEVEVPSGPAVDRVVAAVAEAGYRATAVARE